MSEFNSSMPELNSSMSEFNSSNKDIYKFIIENTTIQERDEKKMEDILYYIKMMYSKMTLEKYPRKYEKYYKNNIECLKLKFSKFE